MNRAGLVYLSIDGKYKRTVSGAGSMISAGASAAVAVSWSGPGHRCTFSCVDSGRCGGESSPPIPTLPPLLLVPLPLPLPAPELCLSLNPNRVLDTFQLLPEDLCSEEDGRFSLASSDGRFCDWRSALPIRVLSALVWAPMVLQCPLKRFMAAEERRQFYEYRRVCCCPYKDAHMDCMQCQNLTGAPYIRTAVPLFTILPLGAQKLSSAHHCLFKI